MLFNVSVSRSTMIKVGLAFCCTTVLILIVLVVTLSLNEVKSESIVDDYENFITSESQKALQYELPVDASKYQAENTTVLDFGSYDFIIVGAGSAGAVIANRLSEVRHWKVLLIEAGAFPNELSEIPALYALGCLSDYNWGFKSVPQTTACLGTVDQRCVVPRGRGLGGTTLINGLMYTRGHATDFSRWAEAVNDTSWSYENVFPYFTKSEHFHPTDPDATINYAYHGTRGYWNVEHHHPSIPLKYIFLDAYAELGYNFTDYNGPVCQGGSVVQYNTFAGKRHDQGTAFISPVIHRRNLNVSIESYVTKVEIDEVTKVATGVIFTNQGQTYRATAKKEVILSAGVISSPQILMLSGIGPQQHLEDLGIPVIQNLSVGTTLRDHTGVFGLQFYSNMTIPSSTLREQIEDYLNGTGPLTSNTRSHVIGWHQTSLQDTPNSPDLELVIDLSGENSQLGQKFMNWNDETWNGVWGNQASSFYITVVLLNVQSVGSLRLNSSNPFEYPLIDYNLLSDPYGKDIEALYEGINFCLDLINTTAFREIGAELAFRFLPACRSFGYLTREYWYCYLRHLTAPVFHSVGTCPAGTDPLEGAVVDSHLKVFGIENLRVADSSVFPFTLSSHSSGDCTMIGEKVSDLIKLAHP
ncbi:glucose dehydrogenase [FAD, quinone]-like [Anoplophora glabripennis]|uniref:glucose dehydrogenase [FAD, quinone]-like n=1 Tax=Anoplophora glabripennis TaxID=217634 RepID=UPI00087451BD|nr:glucose dehydrogenase [FAD, quinone]-like [Anoplophora glabripennis]